MKALCPYPHTGEGFGDGAALQRRRGMRRACHVAGGATLSLWGRGGRLGRLQAVSCCFWGVARVC